MLRRTAWAVGVALILGASSGCGLLCDRYCERQHERCERIINRGACAPAPIACPPGCTPVPGAYYASPPP
jgi:hypothetical protein